MYPCSYCKKESLYDEFYSQAFEICSYECAIASGYFKPRHKLEN